MVKAEIETVLIAIVSFSFMIEFRKIFLKKWRLRLQRCCVAAAVFDFWTKEIPRQNKRASWWVNSTSPLVHLDIIYISEFHGMNEMKPKL